jgi:hypothetical protein
MQSPAPQPAPQGGRRLSSQGQRDMDLIAGRVEVVLEQF